MFKQTPMSVTYVDHMGTDLDVVNAARVSFHKESEWSFHPSGVPHSGQKFLSDNDKKLIKYLSTHNHWSPFSHCTVKFRVKAPIFVARQLIKHTVGFSWNEVSRRYVDSDPEFYFPEGWRGRNKNLKQGSKDDYVHGSDCYMDAAKRYVRHLDQLYKGMISGGICPEQARMLLPQNLMTEWIWTGTLYAWARMCQLRLDSHTQRETQQIAKDVNKYMTNLFPESWEALMNKE